MLFVIIGNILGFMVLEICKHKHDLSIAELSFGGIFIGSDGLGRKIPILLVIFRIFYNF